MPADHRHAGAQYDAGEWFRPVNPNEHSYTPGYGFAPRPPFLMERRLIAGCSAAVAMCLLGFFFIGSLLPGLCFELLGGLSLRLGGAAHPELVEQMALLAGSVGALLLPFALYAGFVGIPRSCALPLRRVGVGRTAAGVCCGLAVAVVGGHAAGALEVLLSAAGIRFFSPQLAAPVGRAAQALYWLNLTVIPAVFEEVAFRGILMQSLRRFGDGFALFVSSVLFALAHILPLKMPNAFLMGLVIGYFVLFTGSLRIGVAIHLVHNVTMILMSMLSGMGDRAGRLGLASAQLVLLALGIAALIALMRLHPGLFALRPCRSANTGGQKLRSFFLTLPMAALALAIAAQAAGYLL
jgi:membrane protease YdiL (CAAX protease family)